MIVSNVPKKTRLCTFHERGKCSKGRLCTFAHSVEELQGTPAAQPLGSHGRSVQVCHHFQTQRRCKYGSECKFSHVRGSNDSDSATRGPEIQRRPLKTQLCRHYQQGSCRHGSDCTYAHDEHELQAPKPGSALLRASGNVQRESLESWLRLVVAEPNPDLQEAALSKGAAQLAGGLHALSLLSLENVVSILRSAQGSLRRDRLESTLRSLGGALMPELLQKYALEVPTGKKLDELLEALSIVVEVERRFGALLDLPSVRDGIEQIVATRGTEDSPGLWAQLKAVQSGASPLRKVVRRQVAEVELQDVDVQELPCIDELLQLPSNLPVNHGTWAEGDEERHRITHYRLCREELLAPLREAVASYLASNGVKHQGMQRVLDQTGGESTFFAYPSCHAVGFALSKTGKLTVQMKFGLGNRRVDFSTGNHLIFGSLVLLFETNSDGHPIASSSIYATIEEFDLDNVLRHRTVGLGMLDEENWRKFNVTQKYAMVESPGYYHAVRPVLRKFRSPIDATPLWQDILTGKAKAVDYFQGVRVDLSCLYKRELPKQSHWACCDPQHEWPDPHDIELDASQQKAVRHILASSVSLVQGPPGTGKSYIGVKAVQLARQALEQHECREPIALICLTNHALDQFLEDLLDIFPRNGDLIRFGGRSKSEDPRLAGCQVNKFLRSSREDFEERTALESQLENVAGNLNKEVRLLADQRCQLGLLLAGMPTEKLHTLLGEVGADLMEAGLYMAPHSRRRVQQANPKGFVLEILSAWLEGRPLEQVRQDASWRLPSVSKPKTTETFNRFSTLAADEGELPSQVQVLTMIDREVGALPMIACETSHQVMLDFEDSDSNSDADLEGFEGLDMDEINTILDDRMDSQVSRPRAQQRARSQLTGPQLDAKIQDRRTAFQRAEGWEREVQQVELRKQEAVSAALEKATSRRTQASMKQLEEDAARPFELRLQRLLQQREDLQNSWQKARQQLNVEMLRALQRDQKKQFPNVDWSFIEKEIRGAQVGWRTATHERPALLASLVRAVAEAASEVFMEGLSKAEQIEGVLGQMRKQAQLIACNKAKVIGMTSTFAAVNSDLLQRLGPRVVVVEEAGELLECQLMACLSSRNLQQVILIGDHKQLRPKVNTYSLCKVNGYDVSLFERLVTHGSENVQLTTQLRMRPEVSHLVRSFYNQIDDHPRVKDYPARLAGVADCLQWVTHSIEEDDRGHIAGRSKVNSHEAEFACRLAQHLVYNGINKGKITLLTPYTGQKREMRKRLAAELQTSWVPRGAVLESDSEAEKGKGKGKSKDPQLWRMIPGVRVVTIDDYQGEENDVIIVSLVRSNEKRRLGFCGIQNRIIVALSRARHGMYVLGNADMFRQNDDWYKVLSKLEEKGRISEGLNLRCAKHPTDEGIVSVASDFDLRAKHGGCHRPCNVLLPLCGHKCPWRCHPFDEEHKDVRCVSRCTRPRPEGCAHKCAQLCWQCPAQDVCGSPCEVEVKTTLPCGHEQHEPCHKIQTPALRSQVACRTKVPVSLACGHTCQVPCAMKDEKEIKCSHTEQVNAPCGHQVRKVCHTLKPCLQMCAKTAACRHPCSKKCSEEHNHDKCQLSCSELLLCGHKCQNLCGEAHTVLCGSSCTRICAHGHHCPKKCYEVCVPCQEPCSWRCLHKRCTRRCHEPCNREPCNEPCGKMLRCGHICRGLCGEPCPRCVVCEDQQCPLSLEKLKDLTKIYQLDCGHTFSLDMLDQWMAGEQQSGGHVAIQAKSCPTCRQQIYTSPRYGVHIKRQLALIDKVKSEVLRKHGSRQLSEEERREIDQAMGEGHSAGGRWFACPNGHPYFIGECGGAMQEATCNECGARIGGGSHRLRSDNQYLANFTGTNVRPAWPGMEPNLP